MADNIVTVLVALLASGLIQYLMSRHDEKDENLKAIEKDKKTLINAIADLKKYVESMFEEIEERQIVAEKDALRTQLLVMIVNRPHEQQEILTLAKHYFVDLQGNWYMTSIFKKWCDTQGLEPEWFEG